MSRIILITGASRGFGKLWAKALLKRGDKVAATARNTEDLKDLVSEFGDSVYPLQLNVDDREACFGVVQKVNAHFGRIDVLVNNAGFGLFGAIEETSEQQARAQMETNFFGLLWLTQAVIPVMRAQKSGHIIQVSSFLGLVTLPVLGLYNASKYAVNGLSETLATEVKSFGINVSLIEPNGFATDWSGASAIQTEANEVYNPLKKAFKEGATPDSWGKPEATVPAFLKLIDSENPPLHFLLGKMAYPALKQVYNQRLAEFEQWKDVATEAHG
ncbi:NAD(P)-dependent dehydrogenase (short-subunit alcohol dehydrogenase family) [Pedobacter cryoconitis]|uniref:NAD(P)-dependent dehydrogenase (Short-subunit alcohol dehydrogenase family) n=1 Tax=Pedobacter cryoconitis TaxID=188932 RepID=A0A7W8ZN19_9SPHI|nr:SDR family NAD(P)-dependent oxidoreductase [Pedobacter cryoconitis]MBB5636855.1 NAD(P)-dependent dehydrogenase (short-subunit alcohol dehydrogenase family) [Pedobacter cryoconitis]